MNNAVVQCKSDHNQLSTSPHSSSNTENLFKFPSSAKSSETKSIQPISDVNESPNPSEFEASSAKDEHVGDVKCPKPSPRKSVQVTSKKSTIVKRDSIKKEEFQKSRSHQVPPPTESKPIPTPDSGSVNNSPPNKFKSQDVRSPSYYRTTALLEVPPRSAKVEVGHERATKADANSMSPTSDVKLVDKEISNGLQTKSPEADDDQTAASSKIPTSSK